MRIDRVKLVTEMTRRDMKVSDLCEKAHVSCASISALRGGKRCSVKTAQRIADALNVDIDSLLPDTPNERGA